MAGNKRKSSDDQSPRNDKKPRSGKGVEARVDPTYGQRSAIPGLDDDTGFNDGDELDYNEDMNALEYLRSVRHEATGIPNLLVAPQEVLADDRSMYENGVGDFRGRYEDGTFVSLDEEKPEVMDAQVSYFDSILERYEILCNQLQQTPPPDAISKLDRQHPTYVEFLNRNTSRHWTYIMKTMQPTPAQVACMNKQSILRLLELLTMDGIMKRGTHIGISVSHWIWSLLARLPDRGELTSEEIGVVRELGKKAVLVGTGLSHEQSWEEGLLEVEAGLKGGSSTPNNLASNEVYQSEDELEEKEESFRVTNDDEIDLDLELECSADLHVEEGDELEYTEFQDVTTSSLDSTLPLTPNTSTALADEQKVDVQEKIDGEDFEAIKARLLQKVLTQDTDFSVNLEPEIVTEPDPIPVPVPKPVVDLELLKWNTKATVDMIITIAGETYGQRDLLEFRSIWSNVM